MTGQTEHWWAVNAHHDRPTILRMAGDIQGKRVLELGCAAGLLTEQLADGATAFSVHHPITG